MDARRIEELLAPFVGEDRLAAEQIQQVSTYLALLLKWNAKTNLTAVRTEEEIMTRHFGESFFAAKMLLAEGTVNSVIDLGSGAGFPGVPIAIYSPQTQVTLIESQNKKASFLKEVIRALAPSNARVFAGRGEDYPDKAELVTLRAVEKFEQAAKIAASLVAPGGRLALMIGADQQRHLPEGFEWEVGKAIPHRTSAILAVGGRK